MKRGNRKGRPNYPVEFKRRLAAAASEAGVSVSKLALANGVNANMVFKWRRELRAGIFDGVPQEAAKLLPVIVAAAPAATQAVVAVAPAAASMIEIVIADAVVRVKGNADAALLRTILQGLRA